MNVSRLLRQLLLTTQSRSQVLINTIGLSIAIAASLLLTFHVQDELSYDRHWPQAERLYRLNNNFDLPGRAPYRLATTSSLLVPAVQEKFADEVESAARARTLDVSYRLGDERFKGAVVAVDPAFHDMFPLESVVGDVRSELDNATGIALREDLALRLFGSADILGATLTVEYPSVTIDYAVTAVYRMPAGSSVLELPALIRFDELLEPTLPAASLGTWYHAPVASYLRLRPGVDADAVRAGLDAIADNNVDVTPMSPGPDTKASDRLYFDLSRLRDIHLDSDFQNVRDAGSRTAVQALAAIAALVMFIACVNFAVLTLARSDRQAAEVGIRKILGAGKRQLLRHYLTESCVQAALALLLGLVLVELLAPVLAATLGISIRIDYGSMHTWLGVLGVYLLIPLVGGLYPALLLSLLRPGAALKSGSGFGISPLGDLRRFLLLFQFAVAIGLIVATSIILLQVDLLSRRDPGFRQEKLIVITDLAGRQEVNDRKQLLLERIRTLANVQDATLSGYHPLATTTLARLSSAHLLDARPGESFILANAFIDENFMPTYDIGMLAGRSFSASLDRSDAVAAAGPGSVLINEAAARFMGFSAAADAVGRQIIDRNPAGTGDFVYTIVGVSADSQFYSLRAVPRPEIYYFRPASTDVLAVAYTGDTSAIMQDLQQQWQAVMGAAVLTTVNVETLLASEYAPERSQGRVFFLFSALAVCIACLGLYGAALFNVERRTTEIGVRKVMGARVWDIVKLLLWQFSKPVLLANLIAWPLVLWLMLDWLRSFPYRIDALLLLPVCVLAGVVALSIACMAIACGSLKAAAGRPVLALKHG